MVVVKKKVKKAPASKPVPVGMTQKSTEPKEWKLTLHRATDTTMGFAHQDNFARFGKQYESEVKSFGWVYVPLARAGKMKTLVVTVSEIEMDE